MLRGENIVCGTSTTGTGTLTLAAVPAAVGGVDFDAWLKSTGIGFVSGNAILVSYTIIEYTTSAFTVPKFVEKGIGTLTLGAALVNATLARTTVQTVSNANANSYQVGGGATAITIGTAANTLVFVGASAADIPAYEPYYNAGSTDGLGASPVICPSTTSTRSLVNLRDEYVNFEWHVPMLVKRASARVSTAYAGSTGTPISSAYARLYAINSSGLPGKLLYDFGAFAGANALNATGNISTGAAGAGFYLAPGEYFFDFLGAFSGATGTVTTPIVVAQGYTISGRLGTSNMNPIVSLASTSGTAGTAPDPANLAAPATSTGSASQVAFALAPS